MRVLYPGKIGIRSVGFCAGRKAAEPREKPSEQDENQQQTQSTLDTRGSDESAFTNTLSHEPLVLKNLVLERNRENKVEVALTFHQFQFA